MAGCSKRLKLGGDDDSGSDAVPLDIYELVLIEEDEELTLDESDDEEEDAIVKLVASESHFELECFNSLDDKKFKRGIKINHVSKIYSGYELLKYCILAKVMTKTPLHTSADERWRFFRIDLKDNNGVMNQIRLTFLVRHDDVMIDVYYSMIEVNQVYSFSNLQLKKTDIRFNSLPHPCEFYFQFGKSNVGHFVGNTSSFNFKFEYSIIPIGLITDTPLRSKCVDIVGKIRNVTEPRFVAYYDRKKSRRMSYHVCDVTLMDQSLKEITVSFWRDDAIRVWKVWEPYIRKYGRDETPMVIIRGLKIVVRQGQVTIKILRCGSIVIISSLSLTLEYNAELLSLNRWFEMEGGNLEPVEKLDLVVKDNYKQYRDAIEYYIRNRQDPEVTITSTAQKYRLNRTTLNESLNKMGIRATKIHRIDPEATGRAVMQYQEEQKKMSGKTFTEVAAEVGVTYAAAVKRNQVLGFAKQINYNPEGSREVVRQYTEAKLTNSGKSLTKIAQEVGITYVAASGANRRLGETRPMDYNPEVNRAIAETYIERNRTASSHFTVRDAIEEHGEEATKKRQDAVRKMAERITERSNRD